MRNDSRLLVPIKYDGELMAYDYMIHTRERLI